MTFNDDYLKTFETLLRLFYPLRPPGDIWMRFIKNYLMTFNDFYDELLGSSSTPRTARRFSLRFIIGVSNSLLQDGLIILY